MAVEINAFRMIISGSVFTQMTLERLCFAKREADNPSSLWHQGLSWANGLPQIIKIGTQLASSTGSFHLELWRRFWDIKGTDAVGSDKQACC